MTTPLFPSVIAWNVLDGGTDAQDGNNYPGPLLQDYAAAVVGAARSKLISGYQPWPIIETNAGSDLTRIVKFRSPVDFEAVRLRVKHVGASSIPGHLLALGVSNNSTGYTPSGGWNAVLFSGTQSHTVAAKPATAPWSVLTSDALMVKSITAADGRKCYINIAEYCPAAVQMSRGTMHAGPLIGSPLDATFSFQSGVDAVTTPADYTTPTTDQATCIPVEVLFYTRSQMRRVAVIGGSTASGTGDGQALGWIGRACQALSTDSFAYTWSNFGKASDTSANSLDRGLNEIARDEYDVAIYYPFTTNDANWDTADVRDQQISRAAVFVAECRKLGTIPILVTFQPYTSLSAAEEAARRASQAAIRTLATSMGVTLIDTDALLADYSGTASAWLDPTNTTDGLHPDNSGHINIAAYAAPIIASASV